MVVAGREGKEEERTADRELGDACWLGDSARLVLEDLRVQRSHRAVTGGGQRSVPASSPSSDSSLEPELCE